LKAHWSLIVGDVQRMRDIRELKKVLRKIDFERKTSFMDGSYFLGVQMIHHFGTLLCRWVGSVHGIKSGC